MKTISEENFWVFFVVTEGATTSGGRGGAAAEPDSNPSDKPKE